MHVTPRRFPMRFLFLLTVLLFSFRSYCQPPVTQQSLEEMLPNQIDPKSMTPSQLSALLNDKNKENTGKDKNAELAEKTAKTNRLEKDSVIVDEIKRNVYSPDKTFGANVFVFGSVTDLSELSTPPLDYPIGVGDHIVVSLWGGAEFQESYIVARDGAIFPQGLGKINVQGLTFENMRSIVYNRFKGVVPPGTNVSISLGQPRSINVNVVGEVQDPGPVTVSAFSNAFNVIAKSGGVTEYGNLRNITIKRNGKVIDEIDVYKYLTTGDFGKHIYLQNNDFVIVNFVEKKVLATGQFKRPMYYQLRKDEGVRALLKYSGGVTADAFASGMKVIRTENEKQVQRDVNANAILKIPTEDFLLQDGDIVKVDLVKPGISNKIEVRGEVTYPGVYELKQGDRLFDVINRAGGVTRNTFLPRAYIFRGAGDSTNLQSDRLEVDLSDINSNNLGSVGNIQLMSNDVVQLFSQSEFGEAQYVEIYGEVRKPGRVKKYGGMTLQDLLYLTGGIKPTAEFGRLEISSIVDMDSAKKGIKPTRTLVKSYAILPELALDSAAAKILLKPYDQIFVRRNPTFELQQNIEIKGLVNYPGLYPRLDKQERLSSYIERAGGVKDNANIAGAVLYRNKSEYFREKIVDKVEDSIRLDSTGKKIMDSTVYAKKKAIDEPVSIDLYRAMKNPKSKYDIILQEGDVVIIPETNPFVSVQGTVQSPLKIAFDKEHRKLSYYIDKAGGYSTRPWRKRIYVTYANGRSKRTKTFAFLRFHPKIEEGCIINVPSRPQGAEVSDLAKSTIVAAIPVVLTALILKLVN